ncbi:MAG: FAD:protein FMN transferase [Polyangiaceae bacterium]
MGTAVRFVAFTTPDANEVQTRAAMDTALARMRKLEALMTSWKDDSEVAAINRGAGTSVSVSPETYDVIERSVEAGKFSEGTFDITFSPLSQVWKFGDAAEESPKIPSAAQLKPLLARVDYRKIELDPKTRGVKIAKDQEIDLGGIAKGFIVDEAADVLRKAKLRSFLVQAGGDLFGSGRKPDGSPWVSGIREPRGGPDDFFATIELEDRAFSTAGDYARAFIKDGKRYHHIIDPRTGFPATACRSVTVWANDALTADAVDDAVFMLGPEKGLKLAESMDGVGVVIVDASNRVHISSILKGKVHVTRPPRDGL